MTDSILCIYHADCADGFGAAWAVHRLLGSGIEFRAARYGEDPPAAASLHGRDVLIVDFSYSRRSLEFMAGWARSVLVLDHHKSAAEQLQGLPTPPPVQGWFSFDQVDEQFQHLAAIFDMERSGAGLTWDYLSGGAPRPRLIDLVEDRDLWRFRHDPDTRRFHAVAASVGYDLQKLDAWDAWHQWTEGLEETKVPFATWWRGLLTEGEAILRYEAQLIDGILARTRRTMRIAGTAVPAACVPGALASEAGHKLGTQATVTAGHMEMVSEDRSGFFTATYYDGTDGKRHFSLRSPPDGADVGRIATAMAAKFNERGGAYAGGGHAHAAGFDAPLGWEGER